MSRHVRRLFKAIKIMGGVSGGWFFALYLYHRLNRRATWKAREVRLSMLSRSIWLRPGVSDWIVAERIFLDREYDPISPAHDEAMDAWQKAIAASGRQAVIVDCGANIGLSSVWFAERFPHARIMAIEPEAANFAILSRNARNYPNIVPVNAAVSDRISRVALHNDGDTPWAWRADEATDGGIPTVTIAALVGDDPLLAVKVDIEGFETSLLRSSTEWVDRLPLLIFEMHDWMTPWSGSGHAFFAVLSQHKRDYLVQGENVFSYAHALRHAPAGSSDGEDWGSSAPAPTVCNQERTDVAASSYR